MSNLLKKDKGFTLIEIVLVLAIAGLIMVIVFLAVAGAQRSRRDAQRKQDMSRIMAQVEQYASSNRGVYPTSWTSNAFTASYLTTLTLTDPTTGGAYTQGTFGTLPTCVGTNRGTYSIQVAGRNVTGRMCLEQGQQDLQNF